MVLTCIPVIMPEYEVSMELDACRNEFGCQNHIAINNHIDGFTSDLILKTCFWVADRPYAAMLTHKTTRKLVHRAEVESVENDVEHKTFDGHIFPIGTQPK